MERAELRAEATIPRPGLADAKEASSTQRWTAEPGVAFGHKLDEEIEIAEPQLFEVALPLVSTLRFSG